MRIVNYVDRYGYKRRAWVRDEDPDDMAETGIPQGPPNLEGIDWELVKRDLHNALMDRRLFSWMNVQESGDALRSCIFSAMKRHLVALYREAEQ